MHNIQFEIKFLADCQQYISQLAKMHFDEISKHWVPDASVERSRQRFMEHASKDKLPLTLVALRNNNPIGMVSLREKDGIRPDLSPWLASLVVSPKYRKFGVGKQLINAIKIEAVSKNYKKLYLFAFDRTIPEWYAHLGWKLIGNDQHFNHPISIMEIDLHENLHSLYF